MTPNISESPQANSAYRPPVKIPWMMSLTQTITAPFPRGDDPPRPPLLLGGPIPPTPLGGAARPPGPGPGPRGRSRRPRPVPAVTSDGRPSRVVCPSSRHCRWEATRRAWLTSCSTSSTVSPLARICGIVRVDALDDHRRQAEGQLVEQQHARVGDQRPADGDRLLLAARQLRRALGPAVPHPAEQLVDALDRPRSLPRVRGADLQVLLHRERAEQPPPLRHHGDPAGGPAFRPDLGHVLAVVPDRRPRSAGAGRRSCAAASTCPPRSRR